MDTSEITGIIVVMAVILGLLLFFYIENINVQEPPKKVVATAVIESLLNYEDERDSILMPNLNNNFCNVNSNNLVELNTNCNGLPEATCKNTPCSVLVNGTQCMAGNNGGPLMNTDSEGNPIEIDYYYYMNQCYGKNCPANI